MRQNHIVLQTHYFYFHTQVTETHRIADTVANVNKEKHITFPSIENSRNCHRKKE